MSVVGDLTPGTHSELSVRTETGQTYEISFDVGIPAADLSKQETNLIDKFVSLTGDLISSEPHDFAKSIFHESAID